MNFGLSALFENKTDYADAFDAQIELMVYAETLGFEEVWMAEHHFNSKSISASLIPIMSHIAAKTSKIRIGSAAVLLPFYNPLRLAEDVATLDLLSKGRLNLGIAKGGPFDEQFRVFGINRDESREISYEHLKLLEKFLYKDNVTFHGNDFTCENVNVTPKPFQKRIPIYHATHSEEGIAYAALHNQKLLAAQPWTKETIRKNLDLYESFGGESSKKISIMRTLVIADSKEAAQKELKPFVEAFLNRKRQNPNFANSHILDPDRHINNAILGSVDDCVDTIMELHESFDPSSIIIKPYGNSKEKMMEMMACFQEEICTRLKLSKDLKEAV